MSTYNLEDTIAAISTPLGEGGIGIVRLSGPDAWPIVAPLFRPARGNGDFMPVSHRLSYGYIIDPEKREVVDEVLVTLMRAPRTYTRQDIVEINGHGGIVALRRILELVLRGGARLAEPGEFTLRAFLNGRIDLAQAEAVLDIVRAKTATSLHLAVHQLEGRLSRQVQAIRANLMKALAYLEAIVDFPEDEIEPFDIEPVLVAAVEMLEQGVADANQGILYRQGLRTVIVGRPNVGKSSLLNALLRADRAIVTPIPGTTRDTVEETMNLRGVPLWLVDTAGIGDIRGLVEQLGVERSRRALEEADLILLVVDGSEPLRDSDWEIASAVGNRAALLVVNKVDLPQIALPTEFLPGLRRVHISALTGEGISVLEDAILDLIFAGRVRPAEGLVVNNTRHKEALSRALAGVRAALDSHRRGLAADFVTIDLRAAINALGEITGQTVTEDLLESIFSDFCVGK